MLLILLVTSYVTTFLHFFIYYLPHHLFYLDMCDVTTYVTPTVGSLTQPSRGGRGGGLPIVGFLNCGSTCKANSNARPQTDLRFARILSVRVGQWVRVRAISRMRWPCTRRADASRPRTFFFANTYLFFIIDFLVHGNTSPKF